MENEVKPALSMFATVQEYKDAVLAFDAANPQRRAEDAERLPAEELEWDQEALDRVKAGPTAARLEFSASRQPAAPAVDAAKLDDLGKLKALAEAAKNLPIVAWLVDEYDSQDKLHQSVELSPLDIHLDESAEAVPLCTVESAQAVTDSFAALVAQQAARIQQMEDAADQNAIELAVSKDSLAQQAARIEAMRTAGAKMANTMFNLAQGDIGPDLAASFKAMQVEWDAAIRATQEGK